MSKSRRPWSTSIMTVMAVTDWLILAILEMEFYRVSQKNDFQNAAVALKKKMKRIQAVSSAVLIIRTCIISGPEGSPFCY